MKYNIDKQFGIFGKIAPPFNDRVVEKWGKLIKNSYKVLNRDKKITYEKYEYDKTEMILVKPVEGENFPCLIYCHGGAFVFPAYKSHYRLAMELVKGANVAVLFLNYKLAPEYPYPKGQDGIFRTLNWILTHSRDMSVDISKFALMGDSAGGNLTAKLGELGFKKGIKFKGQMYFYPVIDPNLETESKKMFTDTPGWNSVLNQKMWNYYFENKTPEEVGYVNILSDDYTPNKAPIYVETCEFDCLRDEGKMFYDKVTATGVEGEYYMIKGAMHGFDTVKCDITKEAINRRIAFIKKIFKLQ